MNPAVIDPMTDTDVMTTNLRPNRSESMLIYETLARERMREAEQAASHSRLVRRVSSARRWERLSAWAARRAQRVNDRLCRFGPARHLVTGWRAVRRPAS